MRDPYYILGVSKNADQQEIKAAWRNTAKALHPDQNPGDPLAANRFTEAGRAYDLLKDPDKRRLFDDARARASAAGGSNNRPGKERTFMEQRAERARAEAEARAAAEVRAAADARARAAAQAAAAAAARNQPSNEETIAAEDMVAKIFGTNKSGETKDAGSAPPPPPPASEPKATKFEEQAPVAEKAAERSGELTQEPRPSPARDLISYVIKRLTGQVPPPERAPDLQLDVAISIEDVLQRINPVASLQDGRSLSIAVPDDAKDGTQIRVEGQGYRLPGVKRGDVVATLRLKPHSWYRTHGYDLLTYVDIDIENAVLGCETTVETPDGQSKVTIPPWTGSNYKITIAGKGLPKGHGMRGNLIAEVRVLLWDRPDQKVIDLMRSLREGLYL